MTARGDSGAHWFSRSTGRAVAWMTLSPQCFGLPNGDLLFSLEVAPTPRDGKDVPPLHREWIVPRSALIEA
jgi:hypothetical protein